MNPDHPLLARAQAVLKAQLLGNQTRLEEELREKANALKVPGRWTHVRVGRGDGPGGAMG